MNRKWGLVAAAATMALALAGCGGGGGGGPNEPSPDVTGFWKGTLNNGRIINTLTLSDGQVWGFYFEIGSTTTLGGLIHAKADVNGSTLTSNDMRDCQAARCEIVAGLFSAQVVTRQSISGTIGQGTAGVTFTGTYDSEFGKAPAVAHLVGAYTGKSTVTGGTEDLTLNLSATGAISGTSASGCSVSGTVTPRTDGNAYNLKLTYGGGVVCAVSTLSTTGVAYFDPADSRLYAAGLDSGKNNPFIFTGTRS